MNREAVFAVVSVIFVIILSAFYANQYAGNASFNVTSNANANANNANVNNAVTQKILTAQEVAKHNSAADCWLIIDNKVYDATSYIPYHPGGPGQIIPYCGTDATQAFATKGGRGAHSSFAVSQLASLYVGDLNAPAALSAPTTITRPAPVRGED